MRLINSIRMALLNVKSRIFHTFLSILGIVIGVAALVGTLSLIDGMEKFARGQISETTSMQSIGIRPKTSKSVNGLSIKKEKYAYLTFDNYQELISMLQSQIEFAYMNSNHVEEINFLNSTDSLQTLAELIGQAGLGLDTEEKRNEIYGRVISDEDLKGSAKVCLINAQLADVLIADSKASRQSLIGRKIETKVGELEIIGVGKEKKERSKPRLIFPITLLPETSLQQAPASFFVKINDVQKVLSAKEQIDTWLTEKYPNNKADFQVFSYEYRLKQAEKGFLIFRIVMGMIVGLSVLVGGIGVMNVMLISVNERTTEIGISKALGAKRRDIFIQFLSESVTISGLGSILGVIVGILATMAFVPIIRSIAKVPFYADYTVNTLLIIGVIALLIGVIFGTYPALRASKLSPVEAMRRE